MWFTHFLHRVYAYALGYWPCHGSLCGWGSVEPFDDLACYSVLWCHVIGHDEEGWSSLETSVRPFQVVAINMDGAIQKQILLFLFFFFFFSFLFFFFFFDIKEVSESWEGLEDEINRQSSF